MSHAPETSSGRPPAPNGPERGPEPLYAHRAHAAESPGAPLLFLFHGTGGTEHQLFDLGRRILPAAGLIAPRGDVSEMGSLRFFRRLAEGRYDRADLDRRTSRMAAFVRQGAASAAPSRVLGLGYSNGANILASVVMADGALFDGAVLMHPLIPFEPDADEDMTGRRLLLTAGRHDPICPPALTERLVAYFRGQGAAVELFWHEGGHEIRDAEIEAAAAFLRSFDAGGAGERP